MGKNILKEVRTLEITNTQQRKACILVGAGDFSPVYMGKKEEDLCIAVDGGFLHCKENGIVPDLIVGDMDSIDARAYGEIVKIKKETPERVVALSPQKDDTDMLAALRIGLERGYRKFFIYGAMGGNRIEHTIANIQCLNFLKSNGAEAYLMDDRVMMTVICDESVSFRPDMEGYFSLFSLGGKAEGVTIKGMKYPLNHAVVTDDYPIGVSNEFTGETAEISVEKGRLLLVITWT